MVFSFLKFLVKKKLTKKLPKNSPDFAELKTPVRFDLYKGLKIIESFSMTRIN